MLDRAQIRSSLARRLGMDIGALVPADREVEGVVMRVHALSSIRSNREDGSDAPLRRLPDAGQEN